MLQHLARASITAIENKIQLNITSEKGQVQNMYDYLIVGAGLYGAVFAREMTRRGKRCLVIDRREHIAGNIYTENISGINVHKYGAHIFHTSDKDLLIKVKS